ncbi:SURF1 family protein [Nesterenkonia sp. HG001]|uniref:SURF1 family protein n=1 Tax=Nesterenkonia sp. HG001 TaxID=2983207 RepID=UPI002AC4AE59|nr:SURF1 family protein [Nesterenkonia sp. HG001]MDZ5077010.1 SURF1 family protein [Nesterenkonia sp. HG001]
MLKTALQPKWIAMLALALILATVFVVLSAWQFGQSRTESAPSEEITEEPVPLTEVHEPEQPMALEQADRIVTLSGEFIEETQVLIDERLQDGESGWWVVGAFAVDGAPADEVIPVVRGWTDDVDAVDSLPAGRQLELQGRLLPPEAPIPGEREAAHIFSSLSPAELINVWDLPSYSGFLVAFDVVDASGQEIGAEDPASPLESVWVGPQPEGSSVNWLNLFYAVEWVVFAGFAFYLWWRLVKDAHEKEQEASVLDTEWEEQWRLEYLAAIESGQSPEQAEQTATDEAARTLDEKDAR